jgi:hypothetical protein
VVTAAVVEVAEAVAVAAEAGAVAGAAVAGAAVTAAVVEVAEAVAVAAAEVVAAAEDLLRQRCARRLGALRRTASRSCTVGTRHRPVRLAHA